MKDFKARLSKILEVSYELTSTTDLNVLLQRIASVAQELTDTESAGILLQDEETGELCFVTATTFSDVILHLPVPLERSIAGAAFTSGAPVVVPDTRRDPRYFRQFETLTGVKAHALLAVPMQYQERRIGVIEVQNKRDDSPFDRDDIEVLTALAAQATIAVENVRMLRSLAQEQERLEIEVVARTAALHARNTRLQQEIEAREQAQRTVIEQQRALAAMEERERMGRELHDGLGQMMGYINLEAQAARLLLEQNRPSSVQASLERLSLIAQDAHADVRNFIFDLRVATDEPVSLYEAIQAYLCQFSQASGIATTLDCPPDAITPALTRAAEEHTLRIIQEALVNVRKHAQASQVTVTCLASDEQVHVVVADNGVGFDIERASSKLQGHFGLSMMRERASLVGGQLEIRSSPGEGAQVLLTVPHTAASEPDGFAAIRHMHILLVDDHPLFLDGLHNLLLARGLTVVGIAHDGLEAQEQARLLRPDVILMDVYMPNCDGLEATRAIKAELPEIKIVMLTVAEDETSLFEAIKSGASGYLLKSLKANAFCTLLAKLMQGKAAFAPRIVRRLTDQVSLFAEPDSPRAKDVLTPRQLEILSMVAQGLTYKEVSMALYVSEKTVKYHMGKIKEALRVQNRAQAISLYLAQGNR